jgi:hypothetical protein
MVLQWSKPSSPVLFLKYMTASDGFPDGGGIASFGGIRRQIIIPIIARATTTKAGINSLCSLNVTVISFVVSGLLLLYIY